MKHRATESKSVYRELTKYRGEEVGFLSPAARRNHVIHLREEDRSRIISYNLFYVSTRCHVEFRNANLSARYSSTITRCEKKKKTENLFILFERY